MLERYTLAVIFYAKGGHTWRNKAHFLSNMSVCHYNEYDYFTSTSSNVGTGAKCTAGSSEVNGLF